jgi:hypothetical protein
MPGGEENVTESWSAYERSMRHIDEFLHGFTLRDSEVWFGNVCFGSPWHLWFGHPCREIRPNASTMR